MTQPGGILSGPEIQKQIKEGRITIEPFDARRVGPGSVDLTLGTNVRLYQGSYRVVLPTVMAKDGANVSAANRLTVRDSKKPEHWLTNSFEIDPTVGWVLIPGVCYLMHTAERVTTNYFVPVLDGKSSMGRIFVKVHETAGYGDPGFNGQYTLEVTSQLPVRVYPGMRFCQMRFHTLIGETLLYQQKGHYTGNAAKGAVASKIHEQFDP